MAIQEVLVKRKARQLVPGEKFNDSCFLCLSDTCLIIWPDFDHFRTSFFHSKNLATDNTVHGSYKWVHLTE